MIETRSTAPDVTDPLTPRERDIARLAARGLTSREVGERLDISVRTVDNHLGTIYSKLYIAGRTELPHVLPSER